MASENSWMPAQGKHAVNVGSSLGRALKARKGIAATSKRSNLPDRDFYSFRYNFKPPSVDASKPGTIEVKKGKDSTSLTVEHQSSQPGEGHVFVGGEHVAKEWDCVLIYDEETGTFTLEKLDSYMVLNYERKTAVSSSNRPSASASPLPTPVPAAPISTDPLDDLAAALDQGLLEEDADGEIDDEFEEILPTSKPVIRKEEEEEEEEEGEEIEIPPQRAPSPPPKPKPARIAKPAPKPRPEPPAPLPSSKTKPSQGKGKAKAKRDHSTVTANITSDIDEELLAASQSARPTKRARPASPPVSVGLALPGSTAPFHPLPSAQKASRTVAPAPSPPAAPSDLEEEWIEVPAPPLPAVDAMAADEEEEEEEIDMNAFEAEMIQHLEESDEDFLAAAVSPEPEITHPVIGGHPISLNQYAAGGVEDSQDEDDYSSSDDSDDD